MRDIPVGASVQVRTDAKTLSAGHAAVVVQRKLNPKTSQYKLRFRDGAEMWFNHRKIVYASAGRSSGEAAQARGEKV